ncbi:unnamed protein product [Prunus brigantina]
MFSTCLWQLTVGRFGAESWASLFFFFFFFFFRQWALIDVDVEAKQLAVPSVCQSASCPDNLCSFLVWWCFARDEPLLFWVSRSIWWLGKNCWYGDLTRELGQ